MLVTEYMEVRGGVWAGWLFGWGWEQAGGGCASPRCFAVSSPTHPPALALAAGWQPVPQPAGQARVVVPPRQEGALEGQGRRRLEGSAAVGPPDQPPPVQARRERLSQRASPCSLQPAQIALDVARALVYLHSRRIVHCEALGWLGPLSCGSSYAKGGQGWASQRVPTIPTSFSPRCSGHQVGQRAAHQVGRLMGSSLNCKCRHHACCACCCCGCCH